MCLAVSAALPWRARARATRRLLGSPGSRAARSPAHTALAADRLSGLFLVIAFGAAVPVSLAFASWAAGRNEQAGAGRRGLGASTRWRSARSR